MCLSPVCISVIGFIYSANFDLMHSLFDNPWTRTCNVSRNNKKRLALYLYPKSMAVCHLSIGPISFTDQRGEGRVRRSLLFQADEIYPLRPMKQNYRVTNCNEVDWKFTLSVCLSEDTTVYEALTSVCFRISISTKLYMDDMVTSGRFY